MSEEGKGGRSSNVADDADNGKEAEEEEEEIKDEEEEEEDETSEEAVEAVEENTVLLSWRRVKVGSGAVDEESDRERLDNVAGGVGSGSEGGGEDVIRVEVREDTGVSVFFFSSFSIVSSIGFFSFFSSFIVLFRVVMRRRARSRIVFNA